MALDQVESICVATDCTPNDILSFYLKTCRKIMDTQRAGKFIRLYLCIFRNLPPSQIGHYNI